MPTAPTVMNDHQSTEGSKPDLGALSSWNLVDRAAAGGQAERALFAQRFMPVIRAYLEARWRDAALAQRVEDAQQEVFLECFRDRGALQMADRSRAEDFRAFLFGVVRNVARRVESQAARDRMAQAPSELWEALPGREDALSRVFDRAWAESLVMQAAELQREWAEGGSSAAQVQARREIELLELRFAEDMPIRRIAELWGEKPERLHRLYQAAKRSFRDCLQSVVRQQISAAQGQQVEAECARLMSLLGRED